jgi:hypothetical protein
MIASLDTVVFREITPNFPTQLFEFFSFQSLKIRDETNLKFRAAPQAKLEGDVFVRQCFILTQDCCPKPDLLHFRRPFFYGFYRSSARLYF